MPRGADDLTREGSRLPPRSRVAVVVVLVALAAGVYALWFSRDGIPTTPPDSAAYVSAAENIAHGRGITMGFIPTDTEVSPADAATYDGRSPLYQYSPGLPIVLAIPIAAGIPVTAAARVINVLLFAATAAMVAWATLRLSRGSAFAAVFAAFLVATTSQWAIEARFVTTEALFVPLTLLGLYLLAVSVVRSARREMVAFVACAAVTALVRFVGVAVIATGGIALLLWSGGRMVERARRAVVVGVAAVVPVGMWALYQSRTAEGGAGGLSYHPPAIGPYLSETLATWITGGAAFSSVALRYLALVGLIGVLVASALMLARTRPHDAGSDAPPDAPPDALDVALARVGIVFLVVYVAVQLFAMTFVHASPSKGRYLLPMVAPVVILAVATARVAIARAPRGAVRTAIVAVVVVSTVGVAVWHGTSARDFLDSDIAFKASSLNASPASVYRALRQLPKGTIVFTDVPNLVWAGTDKYAISLPAERSIWSNEKNLDYEKQLREVGLVMCRRPGVLFLAGRFAGFTARRIRRVAPVAVLGLYPDGVTLQRDPARCH